MKTYMNENKERDCLEDFINSKIAQLFIRRAIGKCEWIATERNTGVRPYIRMGYVDSMERIEEWIDTRFELIDSYLGYMEDVGIQAFANEECNASDCAGIYDLQGRKVTTPKKTGIYIKNGKKFVGH